LEENTSQSLFVFIYIVKTIKITKTSSSMDVPWSALRLRRWPSWVQLKHKYKNFSVFGHGTLVFGHKINKF